MISLFFIFMAFAPYSPATAETPKPAPTFTEDWTSGNIKTWSKILAPFQHKPRIKYLEIGVFEGRTVLWMMQNIVSHPSSQITAVDIFRGDLQKRFESNIKLGANYKGKLQVFKGRSQSVLKTFPENTYDIIYIDGDHTMAGVMTDAVLSWPLLKNGGILIFDDYDWHLDAPESERPKLAIEAFVKMYGKELKVHHVDWQYIVEKRVPKDDTKNL